MEDNFEKYLNKSIKSLPETDHDENLWEKIANELDFEEKLEQTCKTLPVHEYKEHLWDSIQNDDANGLKHRKLLYITSIAASILLFIGIYNFYYNSKNYSISYTTEIQINANHISIGVENNQNVEGMLRQLCQYSNLDCNNPEFFQIRNQLLELEAEIHKLNKVMTTYGESPELIKYLIKMENQKSVLVNEFLKKIES
jgi:hypothetical protein